MSVQLEEQSRIVELTEKIYFYHIVILPAMINIRDVQWRAL